MKFLQRERFQLQCAQQFRRVDVPMHEFSKQLMDPVVQSDILIAAILLDARGVIPGTTIKPVKRNDAPKETGKAPPERWQ